MNPLTRLYAEADQAGIEVYYFPMRSLAAISTPDQVIAIDVDKLAGAYAETEVLGHELGHCATGCFYTAFSTPAIRARCEERATRWAIKKLVPLRELEQALASGITALDELAEYFEVPPHFVQRCLAYYRDAAGLLDAREPAP